MKPNERGLRILIGMTAMAVVAECLNWAVHLEATGLLSYLSRIRSSLFAIDIRARGWWGGRAQSKVKTGPAPKKYQVPAFAGPVSA